MWELYFCGNLILWIRATPEIKLAAKLTGFTVLCTGNKFADTVTFVTYIVLALQLNNVSSPEMELAKLRRENAELQDNNISLLSDLEERQHLLEEGN